MGGSEHEPSLHTLNSWPVVEKHPPLPPAKSCLNHPSDESIWCPRLSLRILSSPETPWWQIDHPWHKSAARNRAPLLLCHLFHAHLCQPPATNRRVSPRLGILGLQASEPGHVLGRPFQDGSHHRIGRRILVACHHQSLGIAHSFQFSTS